MEAAEIGVKWEQLCYSTAKCTESLSERGLCFIKDLLDDVTARKGGVNGQVFLLYLPVLQQRSAVVSVSARQR